jgi:streptogramin lyase
MVAGPDGNVWSVESNVNQIAKITPQGSITEYHLPVPLGNSTMILGPNGDFWANVAGAPSGEIVEITTAGSIVQQVSIPTVSPNLALTFGPDGNIWSADNSSAQIGRLTAAGQVTLFPAPFSIAEITPGPDGNLWFDAASQNALGKITPTGDISFFSNLDSGPFRELTAGPKGNLWMTTPHDTIDEINTAGQVVAVFSDPNGPYILTPGPDGNLWFTESGNRSAASGGGPNIGSITPQGSITEYPIPTPDSGESDITAGPDGNIWFSEYAASQIGEVMLQTATTTAVTSSANSSVYGQPVTFTATVTPNAAGAATPTGTVQFVIDGQIYGTPVNLSGGTAAVGAAALAVGSHTVAAVYSGDAGSLPSDDTASPLSQVVNQAATSTAGAASPAAPNFGQAVTFTATVTANAPSTATPDGSVDFFDTTAQTDLGSASLSGGTATLTTAAPLPPGTQTITLTYGGNASFLLSSTTVTVAPLRSIYVLNPTVGGALTVSGNASINVPGLVEVDSSSATALSAGGNAAVTASAIQVVGGAQASGNATFSPRPAAGAAAVPDPLAALAVPGSAVSQGSVNLSGNATLTINPGVYSQIKVSGNARLTLNPGVYALAGGGLTVTGNASITGSGVLLYHAGSNFPSAGGSFGGVTLSGNGTFNLTASATGPYAGMTLFQSRDNTRAISLSGNAAAGIGGTIYAPAALLTVGGNAQVGGSLVVNRLQLTGNGSSTLVSDGSSGTDAGVGELVAGDLALYVDNSGGALTADELARIDDAVAGYNALLAPYSVAITEVSSSDQANVVLSAGTTSPCGGMADGVLGCYTPGTGAITLIQGWNYYAGADPSAIGASQYDFEALVFHELGHALGLGGSSDPGSVMSETLPAGVVRRTPTTADLNVGDADGRPDAERAAPLPVAIMDASPAPLPAMAANGARVVLAGPSGDQTRREAVSLLEVTAMAEGAREGTDGNARAAGIARVGLPAASVAAVGMVPTGTAAAAVRSMPLPPDWAGTGSDDAGGPRDAPQPATTPADPPGVAPGRRDEPSPADRDGFFQARQPGAGPVSRGVAGDAGGVRNRRDGTEGAEGYGVAVTNLAGGAPVLFALLGATWGTPAEEPGSRKPGRFRQG